MKAGPGDRRRPFQAVIDGAITLVLWAYFTAGFLLFFAPFYAWAGVFARDRERAFQRFNSRFCRGLFGLTRWMMPGHRWDIRPEVLGLRSAVIVCNHRSYLYSILLISLYERHSTIVKSRLFDLPIFGRMLDWSGYIPSSAEGRFGEVMIRRIESLDAFLADGGSLIVFPEGTRSRDGRLGALNEGAFKLARRCRAPIRVLAVRNTDRMFRRGSFAFDTRGPNTIHLEMVGSVEPPSTPGREALRRTMDEVRSMLARAADGPGESPAGIGNPL